MTGSVPPDNATIVELRAHRRPRVCPSCPTGLWAKGVKVDFRTMPEWREQVRGKRKFRAHWRIRFRPRREVQDEMWRLNIPVACGAVRGEFGQDVLLGKAFKRCVALVSLMLKGCGSLDLLLIARSGALAIGECKLRDRRNDPWTQVDRYREGLVAVAKDGRLWQEIERSYGCYDSHHLCNTARRHFDLRNVGKWCARVQRNASTGLIRTFVVRGEEQVGDGKVAATMEVDDRRPRAIAL